MVRKRSPVPMLRQTRLQLVSGCVQYRPERGLRLHAAEAGAGERLAGRLRPAIALGQAAAGRQMRGLSPQARDERKLCEGESRVFGTRRLIAGLALLAAGLVVAGFISGALTCDGAGA